MTELSEEAQWLFAGNYLLTPEQKDYIQSLEQQVEELKKDNEKYKRILEHHKWVANQDEILKP